ncbi:tRNA glutamyl-Q(34) synthetase GluQRS [Pacificimonas flava]|uniref:tRNA glutamyl-Q(34) synthetase GluQRS n=2 Tax=Pacificimonas TaxID=1960290 RepID=A0A219B4L1_9SPHN|nr:MULTISPECIES: tRNA glutamyl-Q(34) synthetase GluQRS [Pacificimonas]MBZ6377579.1 tRNA glutamyl-Q(34) synthetase GluQRS [Pacificimonas aurantium]OWV32729.1 tRNA glutamyl-Q(34) synthetase GluQRS [Pacificimonas flava]
MISRFAPSPTGYLHDGHAYSALLAAERSDALQLRIEDLDQGRSRPEFVEAIFDDLAWLGIEWTGPVLYQSERAEAYRAALARLDACGVLYPCFCTRKDIAEAGAAPHGPDGPLYPGTCRSLTDSERQDRRDTDAFALRLDSARAAQLAGPLQYSERGTRHEVTPGLLGDVVLARKDAAASYQIASVLDDAEQEISLIVRGEDLLPSVHVQRLLQALLGLPEPAYVHHALLTGADGKRLAKRNGAEPLRRLRARGTDPAAVRARLLALAKSNGDR